MIRSKVIGCGSHLPKKVVTNDDLAKVMDTSDEWIRERTGIRQRHFAEGPDEYTSELATNAAQKAMDMAGITADDLDFIIVGTCTGDLTFPSVACIVQKNLGMKKGFAFDVQAACSGFIYGLSVADSLLKQGSFKHGLVIGAEVITRGLDMGERNTAVLFGDGAGAFILKAEEGEGTTADQGILSTHLHSDGSKMDFLKTSGGTCSTMTSGKIIMDGPEVFKNAVVNLANVAQEAVVHNGFTHDDIDWFVPHQANLRIIEAMAKRLKLNREQVVVTIDQHANTSSASIPLAFDTAVRDGRIKEGQVILMEAMGGGFTWASCMLRF